jgi:hypothetical protein
VKAAIRAAFEAAGGFLTAKEQTEVAVNMTIKTLGGGDMYAAAAVMDITREEEVKAKGHTRAALALRLGRSYTDSPTPLPSAAPLKKGGKVAVVIRGEAFRSDCLQKKKTTKEGAVPLTFCSNASFHRQKAISATHLRNFIEPLAAFGYDLDIFLAYYRCPNDEQDVWGRSLLSWYQNTTAQVTVHGQPTIRTVSMNQATLLRKGIQMALDEAGAGGTEQYKYPPKSKHYEFGAILRFDAAFLNGVQLLAAISESVVGFGELKPVLLQMYSVDILLMFEWSLARMLYRGPTRREGRSWSRMQHYHWGLEKVLERHFVCKDVSWDCINEQNINSVQLEPTERQRIVSKEVFSVDLAGMFDAERAKNEQIAKAATPCWSGKFDFSQNKCPARNAMQLPGISLYRYGDCLGMRKYKQNSDGGIEDPKALAIVTQRASNGEYWCHHLPDGCVCRALAVGFGMDKRGCE